MKKLKKQIIDAIDFYIQNADSFSMTKVATLYGIDRHVISKHLNDYTNYNIVSPIDTEYMYYFIPNELQAIDYYLNNINCSFQKVCQKFNIGKADTLKHWLKILGYTTERHYYYQYNRNAFQTIKTEEDAYWLGFLLADGYINEDKGIVQLKLGERDKQHLIKFLQYLQYPMEQIEQNIKAEIGGSYTHDNVCYVTKVCCHNIVKNLYQYNLFQAKSTKEIPYKCATVELEKAYIRGIIDGDGFITQDTKKIGIVGSKAVLLYIKQYINDNVIPTDTNTLYQKDKIYALEFNGINKAHTIINYFYKDATIYLDRKYQLYLQIKNCRV